MENGFMVIDSSTSMGRDIVEDLLRESQLTSPYASIDYCNSFDITLGSRLSFILLEDEKVAIYTVVVNPILLGGNNCYFTATSPYGYTGPVFSSSADINFIRVFWAQVDAYYRENGIITEFVRFDLDGNSTGYSGFVLPTMLNVKGKILPTEEAQMSNFDRKVRKNYRRALQEDLKVSFFRENVSEERIWEFYRIYIDTMKRTSAKECFFFSFEQFFDYINRQSQRSVLCNVYFRNICISTELVLTSNTSCFSFLGGTDVDFFDKRPNDFLKVSVINWARENGFSYYILGGGYGAEDGIFKYKRAFFPNDVVEYKTGRKILDKEIYESLIEQRNKQRIEVGLSLLDREDNSYFPLFNKLD